MLTTLAFVLAASAQSPTPDSFNPGLSDFVYVTVQSLAVQGDGKILVGGFFTMLGGQSCDSLGRLNNTDPVTESLTSAGSAITWKRGGISPEVWLTTFEHSVNGKNWTSLGAGTRIAGGWQLTGLSLPPGETSAIRACGYVAGSERGSGWFVETVITGIPSLAIMSQSLGFANGQFGFNFTGRAGQVVVIEATSNFQTWAPLQTIILGLSPLDFSDRESAALSGRFYRLRLGR